jgi:hypothetical protein
MKGSIYLEMPFPPWVGGYQLITFEEKIVKEIEKRGKILKKKEKSAQIIFLNSKK